MACERPRPLCLSWSSAAVSWAGTGSQGSGGAQQAVGREEERDTEEGDRGAGKSGLSVPRLPSSLRAPPALFGDLAGAALGGPTERRAVRRGHWPTLALCAHLQVDSAVV